MERQVFLSSLPLSLVWVPSTRRHSQYPCPKSDIAALLCNIYNAYILKQRSIGATSEMLHFLVKVGAKYAAGPTEPPECQVSSKCQWLRCNIKYLAFRWGIGGFKLNGELKDWLGGFFTGSTVWQLDSLNLIFYLFRIFFRVKAAVKVAWASHQSNEQHCSWSHYIVTCT